MFKAPRRAGLFAIMALALALPATASAGGSHVLALYKVEKHIDLEGDSTYEIKCNNGDYAVDGMFRIDQVDQDNDWPGNILTAVQVYAAYPDSSDKSKYVFEMENVNGGDAQAKLWVTCLGKKTVGGSHQVSWNLSGRKDTSWTSSGNQLYGGFASAGDECASDEIAVAPGYQFSSGTGHLVASRTSLPGDSGTNVGRNWSMVFGLDGGSSAWKTYFRCLQLRSNPGPGGHKHRIIVQRMGGSPTPNVSIPVNYVKEVQTSCSDLAKGMVHGFDTTPYYAKHLWFFGMDPRIKTRAYKFWNDDSSPIKVWTGLTCFKDKTN